MTVEETRAQLEQAKQALDEATSLFERAGEKYEEIAAAIVVCGGESVHSEPNDAATGLRSAKTKAEFARAADEATKSSIDNYSQSI